MTTAVETPTKSTTLYQLRRNGKVKVWQISLSGSTLTTTWGQEGGKMQSQDNPVKAKGKEGTKSYKDPEAQAEIEYQRAIDKQIERGYVRDKNNLKDVSDVSEMKFDAPPTGFCPPKPIKTPPSSAVIGTLIDENRFRVFKKYDGNRVLIFFDEKGTPRMFSRTLEPCGDRFGYQMSQLRDIANELGIYNTVLDAEIYVNNGEKLSDFDKINSVMPRTKEETAQETIRSWGYQCTVNLCIFDVIFAFGKYVLEETYDQRWTIISNFVEKAKGYHSSWRIHTPVHTPEELEIKTMEDWLKHAVALNDLPWEGYVLRDSQSKSQVTLNGKEIRPDGCWKFKTKKEDDFVATGYEMGTGKNANRVGKLKLQQLNGRGDIVDCGNCGLFKGDDSIRDEALNWDYPVVVRVEYERRQEADGSCKLRFPCVIAKRDDKTTDECVYQG